MYICQKICSLLVLRCLDTNLRLQLSPEEEELLFEKYDLKRDGTICYREFCNVINRSKSLKSGIILVSDLFI